MSPTRTKNRRATQCVQREYSWLLAALAELRSAHSRQRRVPLLNITRHRQAMATGTVIGHGMGAHPVTRSKAETVRRTKGQLAEVGGPGTAVRPVTQFRAVLVRRIRVPLVLGRATTTVEWFGAADRRPGSSSK